MLLKPIIYSNDLDTDTELRGHCSVGAREREDKSDNP